MGDKETKIGEAKISSKGHIRLISAALPWLDDPQVGDYIEFLMDPQNPNEIILRKRKKNSKKSRG